MMKSRTTTDTARAEMGRAYRFRGRQVVVIQQWQDPFGNAMVRIRTADELPDGEEGLQESVFCATAEPVGLPVHLPD